MVFSDNDYEEFNKLLQTPAKWNFIRLGYGLAHIARYVLLATSFSAL